MENKIIYACEDHVEMALDDYINESETAPKLMKIQDEKQKCSYCREEAKYLITND
jgi:CxxH/CxxC protein (TIGR04129 family)